MKYLDNGIFFNFKKIDSYNKEFNEIIAPREVGKTTAIENGKIYNAIKKGYCVVVYFRNHISIDVDSMETRINRLIENEAEKVKFSYLKGDYKSGILKVNVSIGKNKSHVGLLCISLNRRTSDLKKITGVNLAFEIFDEYTINPRDIRDKYLPYEWRIFMEAHQTLKRFSVDSDKFKTYFIGNAYSRYNPFHVAVGVNTNLLNPGACISGLNYVIEVFKMSDELRELILKKNKNYAIDKDYADFALGCNYVNDRMITLVDGLKDGFNFKLDYLIYHNNVYLMIFKGERDFLPFFYVKKVFKEEFENHKKHKTLTFNLDDVNEQCEIMDRKYKEFFYPLRFCLMKFRVYYSHVENYYVLKELFEKNRI